MRGAGVLRERVAFDVAVETPDGSGGMERTWSEVAERAAEFRYERGREAVQAGGLTGSAVFKVCVRSDEVTRGLTTAHRMRDVRRGVIYNLREVDSITDRAWVWLGVENGVAL